MGMNYLQMEGYQAYYLREKKILSGSLDCVLLYESQTFTKVCFSVGLILTHWEEHGKPYMAQSLGGLCSCLLNAW